MKITEEELLIRKNRIIHEAFKLFCENGINKVRMIDIAASAGVGEKSIYRYFISKNDLVVRTVYVLWNEILQELIADLGEGYEQKTGIEQIDILLEKFRDLYENHAEYVLFSYEYKLFLIHNSTRLTVNDYEDELRPIHALYKAALRKGQLDGSIAVQGDVEDMYYAIWGLIRGFVAKIVIYAQMYEGKNPWLNRFTLAKNLIVSGLRSGVDIALMVDNNVTKE